MIVSTAIRKKVKNKSGKCNIKIRISHQGISRYLSTEYYIEPKFFKKDGTVSDKHPNSEVLNLALKQDLIKIEKKLINFDVKNYGIDQIIDYINTGEKRKSFISYFLKFIQEKSKINIRTSEIYKATLDKIQAFDNSPLVFDNITAGWLNKFEASMIKEGMKPNSISIHFRNIRSVFNSAIDDNYIDLNLYPFRRFKIKNSSAEKKALSIEQLKAIRDFQTKGPTTALARDLFMLSFYLIGTNNADLYNLESMQGGRVNFSRAKTHRDYSIKIEPEALKLIQKLKGDKKVLLLSEKYKTPAFMTRSIDAALKRIMPGLTMYHARHSWATIASNIVKASNEDIASALGHSIKTVTEGYIKRDPGIVDKLNRDVLDCLIEKPKKTKKKKI